MTAQEALAQALVAAIKWWETPVDPPVGREMEIASEFAAAIIDALRAVDDGRWDICKDIGKNMGDLYEVGREQGAQQERERLREHRPLVDRDAGLYCSCGKWSDNYDYTEWWEHLADPEPAR